MKGLTTSIFFICFLSTLFLGVVTYMSYRRTGKKELYHLSQLWLALIFNAIAFELFQNMLPQVVALLMVGWIWPVRAFRFVLEDLTGKTIDFKKAPLIIGGGLFLTVAMASYGLSFSLYTLPFALTVAGVGFLQLRTTVPFKYLKKNATVLQWVMINLIGAFYITRVAFPFWTLGNELIPYNLVAELILYLGFTGIGVAVYMELLKNRHEKELDYLLKERNDRLMGQSKYAELGMMSAGIAHEINNPLAVIQARTTQLLRIYRDPERQRELSDGLQQILYTSERINKTIQGVREFVHQDEKAPMSEIGLKDLVDDVLAFTGQRMKNHGINLRFYGLENYTLVGNKIQLEQVLLNLLNNAFDAIEFLPDKWIEVSVSDRNDKYQVFIKDSGHGIPPEIAERMMEPFYSTKDLGKGTGLGLALARGILEKHGGSLEYLPDTSHTTFRMELPKKPTAEWGISLH